jgi:xanthine dehydrogenase accessory factor
MLIARGVSQEHLERIHQPIGLPIKAETPEEIAISILAEIIAVRRGTDLNDLRKAVRS